MSYEDPLTLLADDNKTHGTGTDNVCDLNMAVTRSGLPLEDSVYPSETLCANSHGGEISTSHKPDYSMQKITMKGSVVINKIFMFHWLVTILPQLPLVMVYH